MADPDEPDRDRTSVHWLALRAIADTHATFVDSPEADRFLATQLALPQTPEQRSVTDLRFAAWRGTKAFRIDHAFATGRTVTPTQ